MLGSSSSSYHLYIYIYISTLAVSIFFLLSGFLMMYHYKKSEIGSRPSIKFGIFKIKKIYPYHFLTMILSFPLHWYNYKEFLFKIFIHLTLTQSFIPNINFYFSLNAVSWYLSTIFIIYCCFPTIKNLVLKISDNYKKIYCLLLLYVVQIVTSTIVYYNPIEDFAYISDFTRWILYIAPFTRWIDFVIGCLLYTFTIESKKANKTIANMIDLIIILCLIVVIKYNPDSNLIGEAFMFTAVNTPISAMVIWSFFNESGFITRLLSKCSLLYIFGEYSLQIYLIHYLLSQYYLLYIKKYIPIFAINHVVYFVFISFVSLFVSWIIKKWINSLGVIRH